MLFCKKHIYYYLTIYELGVILSDANAEFSFLNSGLIFSGHDIHHYLEQMSTNTSIDIVLILFHFKNAVRSFKSSIHFSVLILCCQVWRMLLHVCVQQVLWTSWCQSWRFKERKQPSRDYEKWMCLSRKQGFKYLFLNHFCVLASKIY